MILDPSTGNQCDERGNVIVPYEKFQQRVLNRKALHKPPLSTGNVTRFEHDEEAQRDVATIFAGDPGDET